MYLIFAVLVINGCRQSPEEKLSNINGYWEIASTQLPDGEVKEFSISENIDFIEIVDMKGIRKKVQADILGNFKATPLNQNIDVEIVDHKLILHYSTAEGKWNEEVIEANPEKLVLKNQEQIIYTYRKYQPISLD